ncbi:MAG TPA: helix-turn-helix transcriptional regulator [Nitrolancea sp.]|nr:helix-turn-helix transcriptional regulator [Nitrolancea sp.]
MSTRPPAFGELLQRYRVRAALSQEELAERAGLSASAISALERGARQRPYPHTRQLLAQALGLSPDEAAVFTGPARGRAAVPSPSSPTTNLPARRTPLIGREEASVELRALVRQDAGRLLTLTGSGTPSSWHAPVMISRSRSKPWPISPRCGDTRAC